eukprot:gnl/TRDRNA2_/TRDRNA2_85709_c0_seq1.p1 gnl/TRDRNA2_/TRDRNA2_85709_c0~~gnl/TRDRNA2_/TRDRNA2_85709_c0_seq1.p1  ORF type:complete len:580 (+),score=119.21 gnl/TRDRNA2_/TRDRNA2_85709_c0_seq1:131-1741(+)
MQRAVDAYPLRDISKDEVEASHGPLPLRAWEEQSDLRLIASEEHTDHSKVERMLDVLSRPAMVGLPAFSTEETIGPSRQAALREQQDIARTLGKSVEELSSHELAYLRSKGVNHHLSRSFRLRGREAVLAPEDWQELPGFDWRDVTLVRDGGKELTGFVAPVADQGSCGSCYAMAATAMLTSRLMLRYPSLKEKWDKSPDRISVKQHLDCNTYNQGCAGGYPFLIFRWGLENDLVTDTCVGHQKDAHGPKGDKCMFSGDECKDKFRVRDFRYVGGSLGRCGQYHLCEAIIMEELYKGGPMTVSIEPTAEFYSYNPERQPATRLVRESKEGFPAENFELPPRDDPDCKDTTCYKWTKVDHSVLLVGWNEAEECHAREPGDKSLERTCGSKRTKEECEHTDGCEPSVFKYWILQNSWSETWGDGGYMYLGPRGTNPLMVETMAEAADIVRVGDSDDLDEALPETIILEELNVTVPTADIEPKSFVEVGDKGSFVKSHDKDSGYIPAAMNMHRWSKKLQRERAKAARRGRPGADVEHSL